MRSSSKTHATGVGKTKISRNGRWDDQRGAYDKAVPLSGTQFE